MAPDALYIQVMKIFREACLNFSFYLSQKELNVLCPCTVGLPVNVTVHDYTRDFT